MNVIYLGFESQAVKELPMPEPPANYKKPEVIAEWREKKKAELAAIAATMPVSGAVSAICALKGAVKLEWDANDVSDFLPWLAGECTNLAGTALNGDEPYVDYPILVGFDVSRYMRMLGIAHQTAFSIRDESNAVPGALWCRSKHMLDPYKAILGTDVASIPLYTLCEELGFRRSKRRMLPYEDGRFESAQQAALIAKKLTETCNLLGVHSAVALSK